MDWDCVQHSGWSLLAVPVTLCQALLKNGSLQCKWKLEAGCAGPGPLLPLLKHRTSFSGHRARAPVALFEWTSAILAAVLRPNLVIWSCHVYAL
jgi:hypothetical protein